MKKYTTTILKKPEFTLASKDELEKILEKFYQSFYIMLLEDDDFPIMFRTDDVHYFKEESFQDFLNKYSYNGEVTVSIYLENHIIEKYKIINGGFFKIDNFEQEDFDVFIDDNE